MFYCESYMGLWDFQNILYLHFSQLFQIFFLKWMNFCTTWGLHSDTAIDCNSVKKLKLALMDLLELVYNDC